MCQTEVVPDFCTCGAKLPPDARFCHKCGKPQYDYPGLVEETAPATSAVAPAPSVQTPPEISFHNRVAVRVGFLAALLAVLLLMFPLPFPFLWMLLAFSAAGFLAVVVYTRRTGQILSIRNGARMGWITGIFSFMLVTIFSAVTMVAISNEGGLAKFLRSQLPPNDARAEMVTRALNDPATLAGLLVFSLILLFILLTTLPMLGGALGAKVLAKE